MSGSVLLSMTEIPIMALLLMPLQMGNASAIVFWRPWTYPVTERRANPLFISFLEHKDAMWPFLTFLSLWEAVKKKKRCMLTPSQILMKHENFLSHSCRTSVDYKMAKDEAVSSFILFQCCSWILVQCILILLVQVGFNSLCISNKFIDVNAPYQWLIF